MKMTKKGFTLVELMVVIVIVGILAAVAIPKFTKASHKAKASEFPTVLMSIYTAEIAHEAETGAYSDIANLGLQITGSNWFSYTTTTTDAFATTFTATATTKTPSFGGVAVGATGTINQLGAKAIVDGNSKLAGFVPNWK